MRKLIGAIAFSRPAMVIVAAVEQLSYYWGRYRVHMRARRLFPGSGVNFDITTSFKYPENINCGRHVLIGPGSTIGAMAQITLEDHVRISKGVVIETAGLALSAELPYKHVAQPIHIGEGTWIGTNAIILGGVTIGRRAVVAAGAVVTKDVTAGTIVGGIPARAIGHVPGFENE